MIELLVVMGIAAIILPAAFPIYSNFQLSSQLNENVSQIVQTLRLAREYSRAGLDDSAYGVYFEIASAGADSYILYQGDSYAERNPEYDRIALMENALAALTTLPENEINFAKGAGEPNIDGQITLKSNNNREITISINKLGFVRADY